MTVGDVKQFFTRDMWSKLFLGIALFVVTSYFAWLGTQVHALSVRQEGLARSIEYIEAAISKADQETYTVEQAEADKSVEHMRFQNIEYRLRKLENEDDDL